MPRLPALLSLPLAFVAPADGHAQAPDAAVARAMKAAGPIVAPTDQALIRAKCGLPPAAPLANLRMEGSTLYCPNERVVRDPETTALRRRVEARAQAIAHGATDDPAVRTAIERTTKARARAALGGAVAR